MTERICPNPIPWSKAYQRLLEYADTRLCEPAQPPKPLILSGWSYSNDVDKKDRWHATTEWAEKNGCPELVEIPEDQFYFTESPTTYAVGPMGGPMYRPWDYVEKERPTDKEVEQSLEALRMNWHYVVGTQLAEVTWPQEFSGPKMRRLIVRALSTAQPPWGGWDHRSSLESKRREFTKFRTSINQALSLHEVDHVDFALVDDIEQIVAADV